MWITDCIFFQLTKVVSHKPKIVLLSSLPYVGYMYNSGILQIARASSTTPVAA